MSGQENQDVQVTGVRWLYSPDEWRRFHAWQQRKAGWWPFLWNRIKPFRKASVPEVMMVPGRLDIGDRQYPIGPGGKKLMRVQILEAGQQNILCLTCEADNGMEPAQDILVLVPRGKLREAVALEHYWNDTLITDRPDWLRSVPPHPSL